MRKLVLFLHVSLDGFVAGPNGEMDWIYVDENMFDEASIQTRNADTALYGRVTFQMMDGYWPTAGDQPNASKHDIEHSKWYNSVNKVIVSNSLQGTQLPNAVVIGGELTDAITKLKQQQGKDIVMFGSPSVAHSLMRERLIDEIKLFVNPIVLGAGIPLFSNIKESWKLKLVSSKTYGPVVALHYQNI
jgi:dihydrofolate reductase